MRKKVIRTALVLGFTLASTQAQQSQPPANGTANPGSQNLPPGLQNRQPLPPGLEKRDSLPPGLNRGTTENGQTTLNNGAIFSSTNRTSASMQDQAATPSDQRLLIQIHQLIRPVIITANNHNNSPWGPVYFHSQEGVVTVVGYVPNQEQKQRVVTLVREVPGVVQVVDQVQVNADQAATWPSAASAPQAPSAMQDQAVTPNDQSLIGRLQQELQLILGAPQPVMPVHFISREGVVTLVGFVPNEQQRQQIFQAVQNTPGVLQVINQLQVNINAASAAGGLNNSTNELGANWRQGGVNTNLSPTGRTNGLNDADTNAALQNLPPGLQRR